MAVEISKNHGKGGSRRSRGHGEPTDLDIYKSIIADLALVKVATIASPDATDLATAITLVNEIKTKLNAIAGATLGTTAQS